MTGYDADLEEFLVVVRRIADEHLDSREPHDVPDQLAAVQRLLSDAGALDLGTETWTMDGAMRWLTSTVTTFDTTSPSIAVVLASRYAAQRALSAAEHAESSTAMGVISDLAPGAPVVGDARRASVPLQFAPTEVLIVDAHGRGGVIAPQSSLREEHIKRAGLADAKLRTVTASDVAVRVLGPELATVAVRELTLLVSAACLGTAEAALQISESYAVERRQFGSNLVSFAGIRAMLTEMRVRVAAVRALVDAALAAQAPESAALELSVAAGRAAVDVALDAIQIHGGYGYIDEYPVAGLLRDAVSLRARIPSRSARARLSDERFGPIAAGPVSSSQVGPRDGVSNVAGVTR